MFACKGAAFLKVKVKAAGRQCAWTSCSDDPVDILRAGSDIDGVWFYKSCTTFAALLSVPISSSHRLIF